jgi:tRNA U34 5-methylaminomethyl-2-thiouridine-forming methyltransferase MnmC
VRRALEDAGFAVERRPGFGAKRHMTVGRLRV